MSDLSESGSSGLSDWALVNSQGELEGSDADSNTSSIEVVEQDVAIEEIELGQVGLVSSRDTSPECSELEQLMKAADTSATSSAVDPREQSMLELGELRLSRSVGDEAAATRLPAYSPDHTNVASSCDDLERPPQKMLGACCAQLLQSGERRRSSKEEETVRERGFTSEADKGQEVTMEAELSQDSDSPISSDSLLSLSDLSSLSNASRSSRTDSDSESDFVRLEKDFCSGNTESEGEEPLSSTRVCVVTTSGPSVGSEFKFFSIAGTGASVVPPVLSGSSSLTPQPQQHQQQQLVPPSQHPLPPQVQQASELDEILPPQEQEVLVPQNPEEEEEFPPAPQGVLLPQIPEEEERSPPPPQEEVPLPQNPEEEQFPPLPPQGEEEDGPPSPPAPAPQPQYHQLAVAAAAVENDADDGDTESSTEEQDQDDRIESEQSDDAVQAEDNLDQGDLSIVNDIGDLPVERGGVERHYVHCNNQQLNIRLNRVVLAVLVLTLGIGLGHWIGSTREHFSQMEIQLLQMKRLHQMQDEYLQCLSRNDELLVENDKVLQGERDRHQEMMADLRDNNRELGKQLQEAQDELERLLTARAKEQRSPPQRQQPHPTAGDLRNVLTLSSLLIAPDEEFYSENYERELSQESWKLLLQARQTVAMSEAKGRSQCQSQLQVEAANGKQLTDLLQEARQQLNSLQNENAELRLSVGKMRYNVDGLVGEALPPAPSPLPPPPLAETVEQESEEEDTNPEEPATSVPDFSDQRLDLDYVDVEEVEEDVFEERHSSHDDQIPADTAPGKTDCSKGRPEPVPIDIALLQRNLTQERQRADMWQRLYLSEREENKQPLNSSACLQFLSQHMNMSALMHYILHWNLTGVGSSADFMDPTSLLSSIAQLQDRLVQALPSLWDELSSTLHDLHSGSSASSGDENREERKREAEKERGKEGGVEEDGEEDGRKGKWSNRVKTLLNKTRGTLSNVSHQLQRTWDRVKDASRRLWPSGDSLFGRMADRVRESVSKLSHKVKKKAARWLKKRSKKEKHPRGKGGHKRFQDEADAMGPHQKGDRRGKAWKDTDRVGKQSSKKKLGKKKKSFDQHTDQSKENQYLSKDGQTEERLAKHHHGDSPGMDGKKEEIDKQHGKSGKDERFDERRHREKHKKGGKEERFDKSHHKHGKGGKEEKFNQHHHKYGKGGKEKKFDKRHDLEKRGWEERFDKRRHEDSNGKETRFHTLARDHSSHTGKAAAKARFEVEKQFQKLFRRMGSMNKQTFNQMDREDISEMFEDVQKVSKLYGDGSEIGLPSSGHQWLICQFYWWVRARPQRMLYQPMKNCLQYLAPWQLGFVEELKNKLETGECRRIKEYSCIDPEPEDEEDYYKYVCLGDADYEHGTGDNQDEDDDQDEEDDGKYKESHMPNPSTRGKIESKHEDEKDVAKELPSTGSSAEDPERSDRVNNTAESTLAFHFYWMKGRDNLRAEEHKADWLFDRALDREESRHQERSADWVFERAANRDANRESEMSERAHNHWKESDDRQQGRKRSWHGDRDRGGHFKHHGEDHERQERGGHFKRYRKDYRQKYGRTSFCDFC